MAYYTGVSNSYADLLTALTNACVANGWTYADTILSKGALYVKPEVTTKSGVYMDGIRLKGGTGKTGSTLTTESWIWPKMAVPNTLLTVNWPVEYYLHVFTSPDEVYLIVRYNVDRFMWLSFGQSDIPGLIGSGLWLSAIQCNRMATNPSSSTPNVNYFVNSNQSSSVGSHHGPGVSRTSGGFFMAGEHSPSLTETQSAHNDSYSSTVHSGFSATAGGWTFYPSSWTSAGFADFGNTAGQLVTRGRSVWSQESTLIPFSVYEQRGSSKVSLVMQPKNSRFCDVQSYEPNQIITLGADKWRVYPFAKKDPAGVGASGAQNITHTGNFGWAIRYDGP